MSPDGTTFISATQGFVDGVTSWGVKSSDLIRTFGLTPATPGQRVYVTAEAQMQTWSARVGDDGSLSDVKLFVNQGGEGVTTDATGRVYLAAGDVVRLRTRRCADPNDQGAGASAAGRVRRSGRPHALHSRTARALCGARAMTNAD